MAAKKKPAAKKRAAKPAPSASEAAEKYGAGNTSTSSEVTVTSSSGPEWNASAQTAQPGDLRVIKGDLDGVDLDLDEKIGLKVRLGGRTWYAKEPTIAVNKKLSESLPSLNEGADSSEAATQALNSIYPQIAEVLMDPDTSAPPTREFVEAHLTGRNFGRLMERLNDAASEGNGAAG